MAWCKLEFRTMGCLLRTLPFTRKICTSEISEKNTILALHCIHYACSHDRMGILQPDRLWCPWPLPWNYVWDRSFRFHRQNCTYYLKTGFILLLISILMCRPAPYQYFKRLVRRRPVAAVIINLILFALSIAYMVYNSYTPFLYAKF